MSKENFISEIKDENIPVESNIREVVKEETHVNYGQINKKKFIAEFIGTSGLTFFGCGVAVLSGVDMLCTSVAFGLVIVIMAYSIGNISGCHINPAISFAMWKFGQLTTDDLKTYLIAQFAGGLTGSILLGIVNNFSFKSLGSNTIQPLLFNSNKVTFRSWISAFVVETILTFCFLLVIFGITDKRYHSGDNAGLIIGCSLCLIVALGLRLTGTSVNPARSFGPCLCEAFTGNTTGLKQFIIFLLAPLLGGYLGGYVYEYLIK